MNFTKQITRNVLAASSTLRYTTHQKRFLSRVIPPLLGGERDLELAERGIPGLYSKTGFEYAWIDYQTHLIQNFKQRYAEATGDRNYDSHPVSYSSLEAKLERCAYKPESAALFNYMSMTYNNEMAFRSLDLNHDPSLQSTVMPKAVKDVIELQFGSVENFKSEFLANANAIFGGGFVWLVAHRIGKTDQDGYTNPVMSKKNNAMSQSAKTLKILRTYNAGSPLSSAHYRAQSRDMGSQDLYDYVHRQYLLMEAAKGEGLSPKEKERAVRRLADQLSVDRHFSTLDRSLHTSAAASNVEPLLCISVWEHSYLIDFRAYGKRDYLEQCWHRIDWTRLLDHDPFNTIRVS